MNRKKILSSTPESFSKILLFTISLGLWMWCFRGFIGDRLGLQSDAISYYSHIKFFVDNLMKGVYPAWDPLWNYGVPNDFFLRRMGSYNPFLSIIALFKFTGLSYNHSYFLFLSGYWFFGTVGFYKILQSVLKDNRAAFAGFLLLLFSSLGTRLFDSYLILIVTPLIWFFFFLIRFGIQPQRRNIIGLVFFTMTLMNTYIPFFAAIIIIVFLLLFGIFYYRNLSQIFKRTWAYIRADKWVCFFCIMAVVLAMVPALMMFKASGAGEFVLPLRSGAASSSHRMEVGKQTVTSWAIPEEFVYATAFMDLNDFKFALVYVPGFVFILFGLGLITKINRLVLLLLVWMMFFVVLGSPELSQLYGFLYKNVFIFKYFRNLHFFLWFIIIPVFVALCSVLFKQILDMLEGSKDLKKKIFLCFVGIVHLVVFILLVMQGDAVFVSYGTVILSLILFIIFSLGFFDQRETLFLTALLVLIVLQPLHAYSALQRNAMLKSRSYPYENSERTFQYVDTEFQSNQEESGRSKLYYATQGYNYLFQNMSPKVFDEYKKYKFVVYDKAQVVGSDNIELGFIEKSLASNSNLVFLSENYNPQKFPLTSAGAVTAERVLGPLDSFEVVKFNANQVDVKIFYKNPKIVVFNDAFHSLWKVFVDGKKVELFRANLAFKGVYIPQGEHKITFRYGSKGRWLLDGSLMLLFYGMGGYIIYCYTRRIYV